jgi:hypothetical protein
VEGRKGGRERLGNIGQRKSREARCHWSKRSGKRGFHMLSLSEERPSHARPHLVITKKFSSI